MCPEDGLGRGAVVAELFSERFKFGFVIDDIFHVQRFYHP
jgi:hypothetical protein